MTICLALSTLGYGQSITKEIRQIINQLEDDEDLFEIEESNNYFLQILKSIYDRS